MTEDLVRRDRHGNGFVLREKACPTCGVGVGQRFVGLRGGAHQRNGEGIETRIVECERCHLLFPNPFPYPESAQTLYGDPVEYFRNHELEAKITSYRSLAKTIARRTGIANPSMLDVGAGRGDFVHAAGLEGLDRVDGLELSEASVAFAKKEFGLHLTQRTIEEYAQTTDKRYDAIVLNAILEHVHDPDAFMASVARLSASDAVVFVDVPNEPSLPTIAYNTFNRLRGRRTVFNLSPTWEPYHVFGFNPRALRALLAKHGIRLDEVRVHAGIHHLERDTLKNTIKAIGLEQLMRFANLTGTASNLTAWARAARR